MGQFVKLSDHQFRFKNNYSQMNDVHQVTPIVEKIFK